MAATKIIGPELQQWLVRGISQITLSRYALEICDKLMS